VLKGLTSTANALVTCTGVGLPEGFAEGELCRDEEAAAGEGDRVALVNGPLHAPTSAAATRTTANFAGGEAPPKVPIK